jgi:hypothetical protein
VSTNFTTWAAGNPVTRAAQTKAHCEPCQFVTQLDEGQSLRVHQAGCDVYFGSRLAVVLSVYSLLTYQALL